MVQGHGKGRQDYYLEDLPLEEARRRFNERLDRSTSLVMGAEEVPLTQALGRVTAEAVWARQSSPHYHAAAMDGAAVRAKDTEGSSETLPKRLRLVKDAIWVDTGDPMPDGFDAVIMREVIHPVDEEWVEITSPTPPWQHVRPMGEDIVATELVLPANHRLRPEDLGAVAASGHSFVKLRRRPTVAIIPTGSELVPATETPQKGHLIEYNSLMLSGQISEWGGDPLLHPIVPDDLGLLSTSVATAVESADVVVINAGSSAGTEDYTAAVVEKLGELLVHGVAVRPGHPVVLGVIREKPVLGIPGYPASAVLTSELFIKPLMDRMLGQAPEYPQTVDATMTRKVLSPTGEDEWLRVKLGYVGNKLVASPLQRGAGVITSLVRADGLALIPRFSEGLDAGHTVTIHLRRPLEHIKNTIVAIGSHDVTLDMLASHLRLRHRDRSLSSSNVGSIGGLLAVRKGEAHMAGSHLLDPSSGEYNLSFVKRHNAGQPVLVVTLAHRLQGLIVQPGNPKGVHSLPDLSRPEISFVNRQRGSGTRVLLDYKLGELGVKPSTIHGYEREEFTHLAVAADVASGTADVGLGVMAAARALQLPFIPLLEERYDLIIPLAFSESELLVPLFDLLHDGRFRSEVAQVGGYDVRQMGRIVAEVK